MARQHARAKIEQARHLRKFKTAAEVKPWRALRQLSRQGFQFRQQAPIGRFIVGFVDHSNCLVIEADGGQHLEPTAISRDAERTAWLERQGYAAMRFGNPEILLNIEGCIDAILRQSTRPEAFSPSPFPREDRGGAGVVAGDAGRRSATP